MPAKRACSSDRPAASARGKGKGKGKGRGANSAALKVRQTVTKKATKGVGRGRGRPAKGAAPKAEKATACKAGRGAGRGGPAATRASSCGAGRGHAASARGSSRGADKGRGRSASARSLTSVKGSSENNAKQAEKIQQQSAKHVRRTVLADISNITGSIAGTDTTSKPTGGCRLNSKRVPTSGSREATKKVQDTAKSVHRTTMPDSLNKTSTPSAAAVVGNSDNTAQSSGGSRTCSTQAPSGGSRTCSTEFPTAMSFDFDEDFRASDSRDSPEPDGLANWWDPDNQGVHADLSDFPGMDDSSQRPAPDESPSGTVGRHGDPDGEGDSGSLPPTPVMDEQQLVPEYTGDVFAKLARDEAVYLSRARLVTTMTTERRAEVLEQLVEAHIQFTLKAETLFLAVDLFDRFVVAKHADHRDALLIGYASLLIAAKFEEIYPPDVRDLAFASSYKCKREDIVLMEVIILSTLAFKVCAPNPSHFVGSYAHANKSTKPQRHLLQHMLELSLMEPQVSRYPPSHVTAAAVLAVNFLFGRNPKWPEEMAERTGRTELALRQCSEELLAILGNADGSVLRRKVLKADHQIPARVLRGEPLREQPSAEPEFN